MDGARKETFGEKILSYLLYLFALLLQLLLQFLLLLYTFNGTHVRLIGTVKLTLNGFFLTYFCLACPLPKPLRVKVSAK